jgi:hypothetical protein
MHDDSLLSITPILVWRLRFERKVGWRVRIWHLRSEGIGWEMGFDGWRGKGVRCKAALGMIVESGGVATLCAREGEACGLCSTCRENEERRSGLALGRMKMNKGGKES